MNYFNVDNYRYEGEDDVLQNQCLSLSDKKFNNWFTSSDAFFIDVKLLGCEIPDIANIRVFAKSLDFLEDRILDELNEQNSQPNFKLLLHEFVGTQIYNAYFEALKNFHDAFYGIGFYAQHIKIQWSSLETQVLRETISWMRGERFIEKNYPLQIDIFTKLINNFTSQYPKFEEDLRNFKPPEKNPLQKKPSEQKPSEKIKSINKKGKPVKTR